MSRRFKVAILSDIHYAGPAEQARGDDYEFSAIQRPLIRWAMRTVRNVGWMKNPTRRNAQLDRCFGLVGEPDLAIMNGDLAYDGASFGLADDATLESARECLDRLRNRFGDRLHLTLGDHELGKLGLLGERGGLRLKSWQRTVDDLGIRPGWKFEIGNYVFLGVAATLIALPAFQRDALPNELSEWRRLRAAHLEEIRTAFDSVTSRQRILLFCHDPTALPYLRQEESVRRKLGQIEHTVIGHLHSKLIFWKSRLLAGIPVIRFLGSNVQRMTTALNDARKWKEFHVRLCPALSGIQLLNDGGFLTVELDREAGSPAQFQFHPLPW